MTTKTINFTPDKQELHLIEKAVQGDTMAKTILFLYGIEWDHEQQGWIYHPVE